MRIAELDKKMGVENKIGRDDVAWFNVKEEPFEVYGLYDYKNGNRFKRMSEAVAEKVSEGVRHFNYNTAGARVRFSTDSPYIAIRAYQTGNEILPQMNAIAARGFDLCLDGPLGSVRKAVFSPTPDPTEGFESLVHVFVPTEDHIKGVDNLIGDGEMHSYTLIFPLYGNVDELYIGVKEGSRISGGAKYADFKPVVYYGSSITQGCGASRPGNSYEALISEKYNLDYINLGFSGHCRAESEMVDYLADLDMSVFVCDYDHNTTSIEHLKSTHRPLYEKFREKQPDTPIIFVSLPDFWYFDYDMTITRRDVIFATYEYARQKGDKNVYFISGEQLLPSEARDIATVDGCHPNDLGYLGMADTIGTAIHEILNK